MSSPEPELTLLAELRLSAVSHLKAGVELTLNKFQLAAIAIALEAGEARIAKAAELQEINAYLARRTHTLQDQLEAATHPRPRPAPDVVDLSGDTVVDCREAFGRELSRNRGHRPEGGAA